MGEIEKDYAACYNKALDLLSYRPHFTVELERKLKSRGFETADVNQALLRLTEGKFLDDHEAARQFVAGRHRRLGEVGVRLVQELRKRGIDGDLASSVVAEMDSDDHAEVARKAVERLRSRGASDEKIGRHLSRKGFSKAVILGVLSAG